GGEWVVGSKCGCGETETARAQVDEEDPGDGGNDGYDEDSEEEGAEGWEGHCVSGVPLWWLLRLYSSPGNPPYA
ncbi:hypothetical protein V491_04055, partial [Pseudogymnoascus sp. VKM F-3775]